MFVQRHPLPRLGRTLLVVVIELQFLRKVSELMLLSMKRLRVGRVQKLIEAGAVGTVVHSVVCMLLRSCVSDDRDAAWSVYVGHV